MKKNVDEKIWREAKERAFSELMKATTMLACYERWCLMVAMFGHDFKNVPQDDFRNDVEKMREILNQKTYSLAREDNHKEV